MLWLLLFFLFSVSDEKKVRQEGKCGEENFVPRNKKSPPNTILVLADDLGWNEVTLNCILLLKPN